MRVRHGAADSAKSLLGPVNTPETELGAVLVHFRRCRIIE